MLTFLDFASSYKFIKIIRSLLVSVTFLIEGRSLASLSLSLSLFLSLSIYIYTLMFPRICRENFLKDDRASYDEELPGSLTNRNYHQQAKRITVVRRSVFFTHDRNSRGSRFRYRRNNRGQQRKSSRRIRACELIEIVGNRRESR